MKKHLSIILCVFTAAVYSSCSLRTPVESENEMFVVNELVLLRTEGLALAEIAAKYKQDPHVDSMSQEFLAYYTETQEDFVALCTGRTVVVDQSDMEILIADLHAHVLPNGQLQQHAFVELFEDNMLRSIALYEVILQANDWEDISYFSFKALPELYNQQANLQRLKKWTLHAEQSAEEKQPATAALAL